MYACEVVKVISVAARSVHETPCLSISLVHRYTIQQTAKRTLILRLVQPVNNHICLSDAQRIEVLSYCQRQHVLVLPPLRFRSRHGRREASDALVEHDVAEGVLKGGGRVEAVGAAV